jgi:nitrate reductase assembly molybdenum cofactor insertion protein NarJ
MIDQTIQRAQVYYFLSHALLYPQENWFEDFPVITAALRDLDISIDSCSQNTEVSSELVRTTSEVLEVIELSDWSLEALQAAHRLVFGLTGSLMYETELGLPHEFRQSQELADIAGFYQAFGFHTGAAVRERPDHLATELEFMYLLALKEAYAVVNSMPEQAEICVDAQRKFLQDHLGRWIGPFCRSLERSTDERLGNSGLESPYVKLARLAEAFLKAETARLGVLPELQPMVEQTLTPFNPDFTCAGCAVAETNI